MANSAWNVRRSNRSPSDNDVSSATSTASFAAAIAVRDIAAIVVATATASSISVSAGTIRLTRPERSASAASMVRPVRHRSIALALPTARVSRCDPPMPDDTQPDLRLPEPRAVGRDHHVAQHGQLTPATEGVPGDGGDERRPKPDQTVPAGEQVGRHDLGVGQLGHLGDVGTGRERTVRAGDHHRADRGVGVEGAHGGDDLAHDLLVQRVQGLRPVEPDEADPSAGVLTTMVEKSVTVVPPGCR